MKHRIPLAWCKMNLHVHIYMQNVNPSLTNGKYRTMYCDLNIRELFLYYPRSINWTIIIKYCTVAEILTSAFQINVEYACVTVIRSGICTNLPDQTNIYLIWFLFLWKYELFTELLPALLKFRLTKAKFACQVWRLCTFRKDCGLHCANLTKLLRDPPFNIKGVSYEVFWGEGGLRKAWTVW